MAFPRAWLDASKSVGVVLCVGACVALSCASGNESTIATQTGASVGAGAGVAAVGPSSSSSSASTGVGGASGSSSSMGGGGQSSVSASSSDASSGSAGGGGASASSSASSSTGTGGQGGAAPAPAILLLAGPAVFGAEFHPGTGWNGVGLADTTDVAPAIAMTSATTAVGLIRSSPNGGALRFVTWTPGAFTSFVGVSAGVTTAATPAIAAAGTQAFAAFIGTDFKYYYAAYLASWSPTAEAVGAPQSFGPTAPSIAAIGNVATIAYAGNDGDLYDQTRSGGVWQTADGHAIAGVAQVTPTIVAMTSGPDLMIVFPRSTDSKILFTTRTAGVWLTPSPIDPNALSADPIAVAALPGGSAVVAYRGTDTMIYTSRYTSNAWSVPAAIATPNFSTPSSPAVAHGVGGPDAELVFADGATGAALHSRLTGAVWSAPVSIGGVGLTHVAVASAP